MSRLSRQAAPASHPIQYAQSNGVSILLTIAGPRYPHLPGTGALMILVAAGCKRPMTCPSWWPLPTVPHTRRPWVAVIGAWIDEVMRRGEGGKGEGRDSRRREGDDRGGPGKGLCSTGQKNVEPRIHTGLSMSFFLILPGSLKEVLLASHRA